jgi:hypothetical protein
MERTLNLAVVTHPHSASYGDYMRLLKPYLRHFGFPVTEIDSSNLPEDLGTYPLIVLAHAGCVVPPAQTAVAGACASILSSGGGVVSFDCAPATVVSSLVSSARAPLTTETLTVAETPHWISALHDPGEVFLLRRPVTMAANSVLRDGTTVVSAGTQPLLQAARAGEGRVALWNDMQWMSAAVRGPMYGMDDLLWRSLVWAARKPVVMFGMPPIVTMRVDDVWGSPRPGTADPLDWVTVCNGHGIKPWLGLFIDNMSPPAISSLRSLLADRQATSFPHAFAGYEGTVEGDRIEEWIYFNHWRGVSYSDTTMARNARRVEEWHERHGIAIGTVALPHYYEFGANAIPWFLKWGCEYCGTHMQPGQPYIGDPASRPWLKGGPFRLHEQDDRCASLPNYYADYLTVDKHPEYSGKLFNCATEIRDICGYEWAPDNDVDKTVANGVAQLRRAFDSMALSSLFTHETDYIQYITPENWRRILAGVTNGVAEYGPLCMTMDDAYRYVRARAGLRMVCAGLKGGDAYAEVAGQSDQPVKAHLFVEAGDAVGASLREIPAIETNPGTQHTVTLCLGGATDS